MKKLLLAIDAEKPEVQSLEFGAYLARLTGSALTGVFLENLPDIESGLKSVYEGAYVETIGATAEPEVAFREKTTDENIRKFKTACDTREISCRVHRDQGVPLEELVAESRYADLMIAGTMLFAASSLEAPGDMVKSLLAKSECPVIIAPHHTHAIDKILFAFDGSSSALFAIKQFTYLFPELSGADLIVLQADEEAVFSEERKEKLYGYLKEYYNRINFKDLRGNARDELFDYSLREQNAVLIMGAYGRSWLSNLFRTSTADLVLKLNNLPVFITHW